MTEKYTHSIVLDSESCIGCTDCIKRCPTEAIRVRGGKARIINERCIDCGMCIRICRHKAKKATTDPLGTINLFKHKIAIVAPTIYAQFDSVFDANTILTAVKKLGFDDVFEVAAAAEIISDYTRKKMYDGTLKKPIISSACPAITRLIMVRYPSLAENIMPVMTPMEFAAISAKELMVSEGMRRKDIGVFFISPCAAKVTEVRMPLGVKKSSVDGVIAITEIYKKMLTELKQIKHPEPLSIANIPGIDWAANGGESRGLGVESSISVDGVENVISILEQMENGQLDNVDFIEALACIGGCLGGPLTITNNFVAKNYLRKTMRSANGYSKHEKRHVNFPSKKYDVGIEVKLDPSGNDFSAAERMHVLNMMEEQKTICGLLPGIDCGGCGAPNCNALAEDVVKSKANIEDCTFMLRDRIRLLADSMVNLSAKFPPPYESDGESEGENKC